MATAETTRLCQIALEWSQVAKCIHSFTWIDSKCDNCWDVRTKLNEKQRDKAQSVEDRMEIEKTHRLLDIRAFRVRLHSLEFNRKEHELDSKDFCYDQYRAYAWLGSVKEREDSKQLLAEYYQVVEKNNDFSEIYKDYELLLQIYDEMCEAKTFDAFKRVCDRIDEPDIVEIKRNEERMKRPTSVLDKVAEEILKENGWEYNQRPPTGEKRLLLIFAPHIYKKKYGELPEIRTKI